MKKFITGILTMLVAICCFAGCNLLNPTSSVTYDAEAAKELLISTVRQDGNGTTRQDYTVPTQFVFDGSTYTIAWSVEIDDEYPIAVTVVAAEGETTAKIDVDENAATDIPYALVFTITAPDGQTATGKINRKVTAAPSIVPSEITSAPVANTAYKLYMWQVSKKDHAYFTGKMSGFYLASSSDYTDAVDVFVEAVEGKENAYYMTFTDSIGKQYLGISNTISKKSDTEYKWYNNPIFSTSTTTPEGAAGATFEWNWNEEYQIMTATYDSKQGTYKSEAEANAAEPKSDTVYLGTSGTYWTFGASAIKYVTSDDSCIGKLVEMVDKSTVSNADKVAAAKAAIDVQTIFNGDAVVELPIKDDTYPEVSIAWSIKDGTTAANVALADNKLTITAPTSAVKVTLVATLTCGDATDTVEVEITSNPAPSSVTAPVEGTAYKMYLEQVTLAKTLYINGEVNGRYLKTTESAKAGVDVYAKAVDGGYKFYIVDGGVNKYINIYLNSDNAVSVNYAEESSNVYKYDAEKNCWYTSVDGTDYYLGTYNNFNTISASKTSYITADNTGVSQFPALFITKAAAEAKDDTPADSSSSSSSTTDSVETSTIAEVLAGAAGTTYKTSGTVVAIHSRGFILKDNTAAILVYLNASHNHVIGDVVTVEGAAASYSGVIQFGAGTTVTKTGTTTVTQPTPEEITAAKATEMAAASSYEVKYISLEGTLSVSASGKGFDYNNLIIDGTDAQGSISYASESFSAYNGKTVKLVGYWVGISSAKFINIMLTSIEEVTTGGNDNSSSSSDAVDSSSSDSSSSDTVDSSSSDSSSSDVQLPEADSVITIKEALALEITATTTNKYYVTGTIKNIYNTTYGNMYIQDANGNEICVYGSYSADGTLTFDKMTEQPIAGDIIKVYGVIGTYNGKNQLVNAWIVAITKTDEGNLNRLPALKLETAIATAVGEFTLPTAENANVAWALDNTTYATIEDGVLKITSMPTETTTLTLTATITIGTASKEQELKFTIQVGEAQKWTLVTDASQLTAGATVVIASFDSDLAMSTYQKSNNRGQTAITKSENTIVVTADVEQFTLVVGTKDKTWAFNDTTDTAGYLFAASSSNNYLRTESTLSDNSSFTIEIASDGKATITAQGTFSRNVMQYNPTNSLFSCYLSASQQSICLYVLA